MLDESDEDVFGVVLLEGEVGVGRDDPLDVVAVQRRVVKVEGREGEGSVGDGLVMHKHVVT